MINNQNKENRPKQLLLGKIPLIAIIFPPIGFIMLIQFFLNKLKKKEKY